MENLIKLGSALFGGIAEIFDINVPGLDISFFQLFGGFFIIACIIVAIRLIFGTDHGGDSI